MKKVILLVIAVLFMTGCTATANITIDKNNVKEEYIIYGSSSDYSKIKENATYPTPLYYDADLKNPYSTTGEKESGIDYYNSRADDTKRQVIVTGNFPLSEHTKSSAIRNCFEYYNIAESEDNSNAITFATSKGLTCEFNNFSVNVKTPYKVIYNNADKINNDDNIYTWEFNNKNSQSKGINITIDYGQKYNETEKSNQDDSNKTNDNKNIKEPESKKNNVLSIILVIVILSGAIITTIIFIRKKHKASEL